MTQIMPISFLADWDRRLARQDAFWQRAVIDRPVVNITLGKETPECPWPAAKQWKTPRDRWMDTEYIVESAVAGVRNTHFLGDALPGVSPNLGPEVFSAFFGLEMEYGERTSWSLPNLDDWRDAGHLHFSEENFYWKKIMEITDALLEAGRNTFYTGITDLHPGGDAIAAFRDPLQLNIDMIEHPAEVEALVDRITKVFGRVMDTYFRKLKAAGQAITCWAQIVSSRNWYVPSNDFSCMISKAMFDDIFLPGIEAECRMLDASIYHLDGPDALRHLDSLLEITELDAIQWVYGAGSGRASDWLDVYERCQQAGKGIQIHMQADELDTFIERLQPEGVWINMSGVESPEHAEQILRKVSSW